ncbi:MAG TPA: hypothetical protein VKF41_06820 [Bryobacteraceae bacterium]|nr:hypothetical protein [Bryobacteraceae bacterium]
MAAAKWKTAALAVAIAGAGILALALVSGLLYEQTQRARDRERYPQIGRSIDIGGRMLDIHCVGAGQPAVILESGANWALNSAVYDPRTMLSNGGPRPGYRWANRRPPWMLAFTRASIPPRWPAWCWSTGPIQGSSLTREPATGNGRNGFLS